MQIHPYINFNGNCREAMNFYQECLDVELDLQTVGDSPMAQSVPVEGHNQVMHSRLHKNGETILFASDMIEEGFKLGDTPQICVVCSKSEVKAIFTKFAAGGKIRHDLKEEFFGSYGDLTDKFGVNWMFQADK